MTVCKFGSCPRNARTVARHARGLFQWTTSNATGSALFSRMANHFLARVRQDRQQHRRRCGEKFQENVFAHCAGSSGRRDARAFLKHPMKRAHRRSRFHFEPERLEQSAIRRRARKKDVTRRIELVPMMPEDPPQRAPWIGRETNERTTGLEPAVQD